MNLNTNLVEEINNVSLKGLLRVSKSHVNGGTEIVFEEENLIVNGAKLILISQLYYATGVGDPLSYAKVGVGGASDSAGIILKTPVVTATDLYSPVLSAPILKIAQDSSVPSITLMANVDNAVGNGLKINEAGFFSSSGIMFNIKTFPFVLKNSGFSLNLEWVIRI